MFGTLAYVFAPQVIGCPTLTFNEYQGNVLTITLMGLLMNVKHTQSHYWSNVEGSMI